MLVAQRLEAVAVVERGLGVVNRAGADDHQQPVVFAVHDVADLPASLGNSRNGFVSRMDFLHQDGGRDERAKAFDPDVVGGWAEHASRISSMEAHPRPAWPLVGRAVLHRDLVAAFVRLFPLWVTFGGVVALIYPPAFVWFLDYGLITPGLQIIMLGMGLTLELSDFSRVFRAPAPILWGCSCSTP